MQRLYGAAPVIGQQKRHAALAALRGFFDRSEQGFAPLARFRGKQHCVPIARQIFRGLLDVGFRNIHTFVHHQSEDFAAGMPTDLAFRLASRQVIMEFLEEKKGDGWWGDPSSASYYTDHTNLDANPFIWIQNHALMDAKVLAKYPFDHAGEGETSLMMSLCPGTVNMDEFDKTAWYAQSALKASKETGDGGVAMILDHFRRVLK